MVQLPTKRQFTVAEYRLIADAGIFGPDDRVELLEGEVITMPPVGSRHAACVARLDKLFNSLIGHDTTVWVQSPLQLDDRSEPLPDVSLVSGNPDRYVDQLPRPPDVLLLVEVSESSLPYDRGVKLPAYARAGIREVWIVDLTSGQVEVYGEPMATGYQSRSVARGDDRLTPQAVGSISVTAREITG